MNYFPIFLTSHHINALVIGGGDVAARKIELLLKTTTRITVMSAQCSAQVTRLIEQYELNRLTHDYKEAVIPEFNLVIAATDNKEVNQKVAAEAEQHNILVNVVDEPNLCSYITPAIIDRSPMLIAMSSSGYAPVLLRMLREQIEKSLPNGYGKLAEFSFKFRDHVKARIKGVVNRRKFWETILRGRIGQSVLDGEQVIAEQELIASLNEPQHATVGEIVFIHTLDGNPDKLTLEAHREMQFAEAVFYDEEVNPDFIEYVRRDADKYPQQIASSIMINIQHALELAEAGQRVIYLLADHQAIPHNSALAASFVRTRELINGR